MDTHIRVSTKALILRDNAILLVEYDDETGLHYNMPGGGVEPDETLEEALKREVQEETCAEVEIGRPLIIVEYEPKRNAFWGGTRHALIVIFECRLTTDTEPRMPQKPDPNQTAVKWIPLVDLDKVELLPHVTDHILTYANKQGNYDPIYLCEPINPQKVQKYLFGLEDISRRRRSGAKR